MIVWNWFSHRELELMPGSAISLFPGTVFGLSVSTLRLGAFDMGWENMLTSAQPSISLLQSYTNLVGFASHSFFQLQAWLLGLEVV